MKRILLIGNSPLPEQNARIRPAAGLRTWQFYKGLLRTGRLDVRLVTIDMPECGGGAVEASGGSSAESSGGATNSKNLVISKDDPLLGRKLQEVHDEFQPEAIISVNTYPSYVAAGLRSHAPLWADLNGWIMAEAQAQAYKMGSNDYLGHYFKMENLVMRRADKFSAVSRAESHALLGELACFGRLNAESFGYKFVEHVPNGIEWFEGEGSVPGNGNENRNGLDKPINEVKSVRVQTCVSGGQASKIPKDAFVLLWVGGYNTWVDEITLFKGVAEAMRRCEKLIFASTGGGIAGLDSKTFEKFKKMIDESDLRERFVFLGWVETSEMPAIYARANAGLNVDRRCVETFTGARNRINEMMKFGLPVITTLGSEIAGEVERVGAGLVVRSGDHGGLSEAIGRTYEEWRDGGGRETTVFKNFGKKGREYIENFCNYDVTLKPLFAWLENPRPAPDRGLKVAGFGGGNSGFSAKLPDLRAMWRYLKQNGFKKSFQKFLQRMRR